MDAICSSVPPVGMNASPLLLKNFAPRAQAAPQPPSFVALPPRPRMMRVQQKLKTKEISYTKP